MMKVFLSECQYGPAGIVSECSVTSVQPYPTGIKVRVVVKNYGGFWVGLGGGVGG